MTFRRAHFDVEGRHPFVVGEAENLRNYPELRFPAFDHLLIGVRIKNVIAVGRSKHADLLFNEERIVAEDCVHGLSLGAVIKRAILLSSRAMHELVAIFASLGCAIPCSPLY